jgi:hypothetical protein
MSESRRIVCLNSRKESLKPRLLKCIFTVANSCELYRCEIQDNLHDTRNYTSFDFVSPGAINYRRWNLQFDLYVEVDRDLLDMPY